MTSIQTGIELNDQFSGVLNNIIDSVNLAVAAMYDMQQSMNADIDTSSIEAAKSEIDQATMAMDELNQAASQTNAPDIAPPAVDDRNGQVINVDVNPILPNPLVENPEPIRPDIQPNAPPEPIEVPVTWNSDGMEVFTDTGVERFQQEIQSANNMLNTLNVTQAKITQTAHGMDILPDAAVQDINTMQQRLSAIQQRIQQIENNPVNIGADNANAELEQLRMQLNRAIQEQDSLNQAMQNMDVSAANDAYLRLSQTVGNTERYIRDNVDEQGSFNQEISSGTQQANELTDTIKRAVAAYVSIQSVGKALDISDSLTQTIARLNLMNDGAQTTQELFNMIYASAQQTHSPIMDTADAIARMGNNAGAAFSSNVELIAFMDQVNKQFAIGGASAMEQSNALLQLSQAMAAGALRGDELNSILDAAPGIARTIEESMGWAEGSIKSYAEEGEVTAQVVKKSLLDMADQTNAAFESMPITFSQAMTDLRSTAVKAFQPVLERLNDIANSEAFQSFVSMAVEAMATLANILVNVFDMAVSIGTFIGDNWSVIAPIVYGIVAALGIYTAALIAYNIQKAIAAVREYAHATAILANAGAYSAETVATASATVAQTSFNTALAACPITWIILLIIALIAIIFAVCNAIAKTTGVANSGFGVITGGVNVVIQFFKNLGLTVANIALGIGNAIAALGSNIMTAFHNAICSVQSWWYDLLSTALSVVEGICAALNKLPFVDFDYSGISSAADDYAAKSAEAAGNKEEYKSIGDAFNEGFSSFDAFQSGWASDAFNAGTSWGDGLAEKVSDFSLSDITGKTDIPNPSDYTSGFSDAIASSGMGDVGDSVGNIDDNTGKIKDSLDVTQEDLKYLRDIAEQESINRFTTAEINVDMSGMQNTVNSGDDIDGFMTKLTDSVNEAVDNMTEGVHA
nr:MAG TPA: tail length tape measure protein [Caudoviricetes sp.]